MASRRFEIVNLRGLHARASAKLVELVERFDATATISARGESASADSIMGLLMLTAAMGTKIDVETCGAEAEELADAIGALVANRFGEDD